MSRFSELIDQVADQKNHSLSDVLLKAKVLASQLRSRKFRQWVEAEINGYDMEAELPDYRILSSKLIGEYAGYFHSTARSPMSVSHLDQQHRERFSTHHVHNGVAFVEDVIIGGDESLIGVYLDGYAVNYLRQHGTQMSEMILNRVFKQISRHSCQQLLQSVRCRLLDFLLELRSKYPELDKDDSIAAKVTEADVDSAMASRVYHNCTVLEEVEMRDNYQAGQAGAMGPKAKAENINFIQILRTTIGDNSLADLAKELEQLRTSMLAESKTEEQDGAVASVAEAEEAAKKGDAKGVLSYLKQAGQWALDKATAIGTPVAIKAIEKAMELS